MAETPPFAAWGLSETALSPAVGGNRNTVLYSDTHVFKTTRRSEAALLWLDPVQVLAEQAGLKVPRLLPSRHGALKVRGWTCEDRVGFKQGNQDDLIEARERIAWVHKNAETVGQRPDFDAMGHLEPTSISGDIDLGALPDKLAITCINAWRSLPAGPLCPIHGDLGLGNLGRSTSGKLVLYDWDEARSDHPWYDTGNEGATKARLAYEIASSWRIEPEYARSLVAQLN